MTVSVFFNRVMFTAASSGLSDFTVGAAAAGYSTPATRGVPNNTIVSYTAQSADLTQWETGQGTYLTAGPTVTRTTVRESSTGGKVNFTAPPTVWLDSHAQDILEIDGGITYAAGGQLSLALGTIAANAIALNVTATWNNAAITFDAPLLMNVTNTASAAGSLLMDLQVGGVSRFKVGPGSGTTPAVTIGPGPGFSQGDVLSILDPGGNVGWRFNSNNGNSLTISDTGNGCGFTVINTSASAGLGPGFFLLTAAGIATDIVIQRDGGGGNGTLNVWGGGNNPTQPKTLRIYNTVDTIPSPTNYERGTIDWTTLSGFFTIGTEAGGTGSARSVFIKSAQDVYLRASTFINFQAFNGTSVFQVLVNTGQLQVLGATGQLDLALNRIAGSVLEINKGTAGNHDGWLNWGGQARVTGDVTNSTVTLATATGLSVALAAGRTYSFQVELSFTDAAAGGIQAAMVATGGLTATDIRYDGWIVDSAANGIKGNAQAAALGGVVASATTTGTAGHVSIYGTITVNVAGTLNVQFAQNTSNATATTIKRGSYMIVHDMP